MKNILSKISKVVLITILLFLCLSSSPVNAGLFDGGIFSLPDNLIGWALSDDDDESEESVSISEAIENEGGGLFETTIARALGGIAQAVFNITTSDTINLGFKNYDELIFNKTELGTVSINTISPFNQSTWNKIMSWYAIFTTLAIVPILIGTIVTSYKFIVAGTNIQKRNDAKDSFMRLFLGGIAIALAPIFVKLLLNINAYMVYILTSSTSGGLDKILGNNIFSEIQTGSAIATALVICLFAYLFIKFNVKFIIRKFTLIVFIVFTPLISGMWIINKNVTGAAIWFGQIFINVFMQFVYAFLFLIYMSFTSSSDGWAASLLWAMMILPLGEVLLNTMQNLVSRVAGLNNEEISNRGIGVGAAMAYTVHSIGAQFKSNNENGGIINKIRNITNRNTENQATNKGNSSSGFNKTTVENKKSIKPEQKETENINRKKRSNVSLYGIGRSFLNTGMFLAEGRNFANKGFNGNRRNYRQSNRNSEIDNEVIQNNDIKKDDENEE